ncbi:2-pyrone-4,6-dicarboxylate hydrolase [Marinomonas pontica]|jgi:predicted TIM-barrel fold metal-dependent hydrolase|uniref:2-pyrone-4,6-dicarboxylate hydrolase n=1 Tax=Marinomonas pontica TaxID=264739 RepID=A0ABM8FBR8_9GAMM|nr:amidohydrolase family protein [Marinomonas pontica]MCW8356552.1 amidohydrolase family protein [Marinomonas pontica]BDX02524.1 2-pyrone-4,6-dicarboxylate hydrolase [Marinomonas pontica]
MSVFTERKIDCHNHIFDPQQFPYQADSPYAPEGHEVATADYFLQVLETYGVSHALLIGPNSAYGENDNRALLDAIARSNGRFKGMAVVKQDTLSEELATLKSQGIVGVTFNVAYYGFEHFARSLPLMDRLADLEMIVQVQVENEQMLRLAPLLMQTKATILIDHCGRPNLEHGVNNAGFQAILALAKTQRAYIKISGFAKFTQGAFPYTDTKPYVEAIVENFGEDFIIWGSDWPFLKAQHRMDYGTLLTLAEKQFPDTRVRAKFFWENAAKLCGFPI